MQKLLIVYINLANNYIKITNKYVKNIKKVYGQIVEIV